MADTTLTLAVADYTRVMPLVTGAVTAEAIKLTITTGHHASWPDRAEILRRSVSDPTIDAAEGSMGNHLARIDQGDRRFIALPAFVLRNFTARDLYVRKDGNVRTIQDLAGKRLGMYSWTASGSIWYRHFLRWSGVDLTDLQWWIGEVDVPQIAASISALPSHVHQPHAAPPLTCLCMKPPVV